jgi:pimeloyl-ACP methyl ester carboxylesterase
MCVLALGLMGCSETAGTGGSGGTAGSGGEGGAAAYESKDLWLCRPDIENDHCDTADLSTTEIGPDGTMVTLTEVAPNPDAEVDCFYVYPTMNHSPEPGNTENLFPHPEAEVAVVSWQAAHYRGLCRVFAPLYRQMSLITYTEYWPNFEDTEYFKKAYDDIVDAFEYYMSHENRGRDFVLIGHSQGSHILTKLLEDKFDDDEALREQLVSAVLTGPTNRLQVLPGEVVGGSFANIPLCTTANETGCVIAFDANPAGVDDTFYDVSTIFSPPSARACVNPASFEGGPATLAAFVYPRSSPGMGQFFPEGVDTEWVRYPNIYMSWCSDDIRQTYVLLVDLASDYAGEAPITPQEIQDAYAAQGSNRNLHGVETYIASTDLLSIVEQQIASRGN